MPVSQTHQRRLFLLLSSLSLLRLVPLSLSLLNTYSYTTHTTSSSLFYTQSLKQSINGQSINGHLPGLPQRQLNHQLPPIAIHKQSLARSPVRVPTALHVLTTPESIIESTSTQDLLDDLIDESTRIKARRPIILQFDPTGNELWKKWRGTG